MTTAELQILLEDLSARLPYGVIVRKTMWGNTEDVRMTPKTISDLLDLDTEVLPYLRPMSSMTPEEKKEFEDFCVIDEECFMGREAGLVNQAKIMSDGIKWLLKHHFDINGLHKYKSDTAPKGLALKPKKGFYE